MLGAELLHKAPLRRCAAAATSDAGRPCAAHDGLRRSAAGYAARASELSFDASANCRLNDFAHGFVLDAEREP